MIPSVLIFKSKGVFHLNRNGTLTSLFVILTYIAIQVGGGFLASFFVFIAEYDAMTSLMIANMISFIIGLIVILFIFRKQLKEERLNNPMSLGKILLWMIIGFFLAYGGQMIAATIEIFVLGIEPGSENTELIVELSEMNVWFLLLPALIGPILEELVFRKALFGTLSKWINLHFAAIISALIFALAHFDFEHTLIYFVMGLVFTFLYVKTKRIIIPILAHMLMNFLVVLAQMFVDPEQLENLQEQLSFILLGGWF